MTSSLVGSEMCIRDRPKKEPEVRGGRRDPRLEVDGEAAALSEVELEDRRRHEEGPGSGKGSGGARE
eukprot:571340-Prorocentrum_lima.AAC.1